MNNLKDKEIEAFLKVTAAIRKKYQRKYGVILTPRMRQNTDFYTINIVNNKGEA